MDQLSPPGADPTPVAALLEARSIAVVGASADQRKPSGMILRFLESSDYPGRVFPVNPGHQRLGRWQCYPSVQDLPEAADLAVVATPAAAALGVLTECAEVGMPSAVVMSGGFGEGGTGPEGRQRAEQLRSLVRRTGVRVLGPNTVGLVNFGRRLPVTFADWYQRDTGQRGPVAVLTQSGSVGGLAFSLLQRHGVGVDYWVGLGNETDLELADFLGYFAHADDVRTVVCFLEGLTDGQRFIEAASTLRATGRDLVVLTAGRSAAAQRSALSHTGKVSGSAQVSHAVFAELGVIEVRSLHELAYVTKVLSLARRPVAASAGVLSASGGACSLIADHAEAAGVTLPDLPVHVQERLRTVIPEYGSPQNPVDLSANVIGRAEILTGALAALPDAAVDIGTWLVFGRPLLDRYSADIAESARRLGGTLIACSGVPVAPEIERQLAEAGVPVLEDPELCLRAIGQVARLDSSRRPVSALVASPAERRACYRRLGRTLADPRRVYPALAAHDVPVARTTLLEPEGAAIDWSQLGPLRYPVAVKVSGAALPHRSELGCVRLGLPDLAALQAAAAAVLANARRQLGPDQRLVLEVQEMVPPGPELLLSITQDRDFGPVAVAGLGGTEVEIHHDTVTMTFPNSADVLLDRLRDLRGWPLLAGFRGRPAVDLGAVAHLWDRLTRFYLAEEWVAEVELNPVILAAAGAARAVDVLVTEAAW